MTAKSDAITILESWKDSDWIATNREDAEDILSSIETITLIADNILAGNKVILVGATLSIYDGMSLLSQFDLSNK